MPWRASTCTARTPHVGPRAAHQPVVQPFSTLAQTVLGSVIGPGDEAVDRYGDGRDDLAHRSSSVVCREYGRQRPADSPRGRLTRKTRRHERNSGRTHLPIFEHARSADIYILNSACPCMSDGRPSTLPITTTTDLITHDQGGRVISAVRAIEDHPTLHETLHWLSQPGIHDVSPRPGPHARPAVPLAATPYTTNSACPRSRHRGQPCPVDVATTSPAWRRRTRWPRTRVGTKPLPGELPHLRSARNGEYRILLRARRSTRRALDHPRRPPCQRLPSAITPSKPRTPGHSTQIELPDRQLP
jgi:hypothetical protein